jgi:hypothetical protein
LHFFEDNMFHSSTLCRPHTQSILFLCNQYWRKAPF